MALECSERVQREAAISIGSLYKLDIKRTDALGNFSIQIGFEVLLSFRGMGLLKVKS